MNKFGKLYKNDCIALLPMRIQINNFISLIMQTSKRKTIRMIKWLVNYVGKYIQIIKIKPSKV